MSKYYFGYNPGHYNLKTSEIEKIRDILYDNDQKVVEVYEKRFLKNIGEGHGLSIASGRMAFYILLNVLDVGKGDEVIVVGFTCSVMINAILRIGATPVYSDVDPVTFGSSAKSIAQKISKRTKIIVAQHSFGIPCDIIDIVKLAKEQDIFVLEDCSLAYGSSVNGIVLGNFGDAAIFSSDHTKPINTLVGGFFYTKNEILFKKVKSHIKNIPELSDVHKKNLFHQLLFEKKWHSPSKYQYAKYFSLSNKVLKKILGPKVLFLDQDNGPPELIKPNYPYPAKLPSFLAQVGIYELQKFEREKMRRKYILNRYLKIFINSKYKNDISQVYFDKSKEIVPLRFVFSSEKTSSLIQKLSFFIEFSQIWFRKPIIATSFDLKQFGYNEGLCPKAETIGEHIINFPCVISERYEKAYFELLEKEINKSST